jgi:hypothetical protein
MVELVVHLGKKLAAQLANALEMRKNIYNHDGDSGDLQ